MYQDIFMLQYKKKLPKFDELDVDNFIWLPLKSVPLDEHYPVNSMRQPALKIFNLLTWTACKPLATDEQKIMSELALEHDEMGYFLVHYRDIFGVIGVEEYHNGRMPGRAAVFNATKRTFRHRDNDMVPIMLELIYSELSYPCKDFIYAPGKISDCEKIYYDKSDFERESLDD